MHTVRAEETEEVSPVIQPLTVWNTIQWKMACAGAAWPEASAVESLLLHYANQC